MLAVCPKCQRTIPVDSPGWNTCKFCVKEIWVPDPLNPDETPTPPSPPPAEIPAAQPDPMAAEAVAIPWEGPGSGPVIGAFLATARGVLFRNRTFFREISSSPLNQRLLLYGELVIGTGLVFYFLLQALSLSMLRQMQRLPDGQAAEFPFMREMLASMEKLKLDTPFFILSAILTPLFAWAILWITTQIFSVGYSLATRTFEAPRARMFRLVVYSYTPWLFLAIPLVGIVWTLIVQYRALRSQFQLSARVAILLVTLNILFLNGFYNLWVTIHAFFLA